MRNFKELLTGQGEDLFHKNMRKFGATVLESHRAFKDIKEGNIEGGGGSASGSAVEYLDVSGLTSSERIQIASIAILCKHTEFELYGEIQDAGIANMGSFVLLGESAMAVLQNNVHAIMVDFSIKVTRTGEQGLFPIKETLFGFPVYDKLDSLPRITEEEFYTL